MAMLESLPLIDFSDLDRNAHVGMFSVTEFSQDHAVNMRARITVQEARDLNTNPAATLQAVSALYHLAALLSLGSLPPVAALVARVHHARGSKMGLGS